MKLLRICALSVGSTLAIACGDDALMLDASVTDGATADASFADAATADAGADDAAAADASLTDAGVRDATLADAMSDSTADGAMDAAAAEDIEVRGTWNNSFIGIEEIQNTVWGSAAVLSYDNTANSAITQNASDAVPPNTFNKLVWTEIEADVFHYCTVDFALATAEDAENTAQTADAADLEGGCGGFAWTEMTRTK